MAVVWILLALLNSISAKFLSQEDILRRLDALQHTVQQNEADLFYIKSQDDDQALKMASLETQLGSATTVYTDQGGKPNTQEPAVKVKTESTRNEPRSLEDIHTIGQRRRSISDLTGATSGVYQRVAFTATFAGNTSQILHDSKPTRFQNVLLNIRRGYNSTSGIFVTPVPGVYLFSFTALSDEGRKCSLELVKNGEGVSVVRAAAVPLRRDQGSATALLLLQEADKVYIRGYSSEGVPFWGDEHSVFTGVLLWALA